MAGPRPLSSVDARGSPRLFSAEAALSAYDATSIWFVMAFVTLSVRAF